MGDAENMSRTEEMYILPRAMVPTLVQKQCPRCNTYFRVIKERNGGRTLCYKCDATNDLEEKEKEVLLEL